MQNFLVMISTFRGEKWSGYQELFFVCDVASAIGKLDFFRKGKELAKSFILVDWI